MPTDGAIAAADRRPVTANMAIVNEAIVNEVIVNGAVGNEKGPPPTKRWRALLQAVAELLSR